MIKSITTKLSIAAAGAAIGSAFLLAPLTATAGGTQSMGHGVKCYYVQVSYDPATGSRVYERVCRKVGV